MTIRDIEKRIVDLIIREKELTETRTGERAAYLKAAENHPTVERIIEDIVIRGLGADRRGISRYSQEGKCSGAGGDEVLDEVLVTVFAALDDTDPRFSRCADISLKLRITGGFENETTRAKERALTAEIMALRGEIETLKKQKRRIKNSGGRD